jgi:hypothetical protein
MIQGMNKLTQKTVGLFKKREMDDEVVVTLPWFILSHDSAEVLEENFPYCSNTFKMCMYPEELCVGTMLAKFSDAKHVDKNVWAIGKNGYELMKPIKPADRETIRSMPEALFAAKINADNIDLYQDTFDLYTQKD